MYMMDEDKGGDKKTDSKRYAMPISSLQKAGETSVLIIEDDKFLRDLMMEKLAKEGYTVYGAITGEEGLKQIKDKKPTLTLLDLVLPGMDGFELLKTLKEDGTIGNAPVIVLSNLGTKEDIDRAMELGAKDFLIKAHFTPAEIVETVKKTIQESYL